MYEKTRLSLNMVTFLHARMLAFARLYLFVVGGERDMADGVFEQDDARFAVQYAKAVHANLDVDAPKLCSRMSRFSTAHLQDKLFRLLHMLYKPGAEIESHE